ncbi:hypothetical protein [Nakamurella multipartita]|uniref:Uncharacterized protein n=1 Tax=Nakamurella multipartita (strain ATCC 700099 / DSM 44233 / CIP 104796 / JCM 9543 / NBRC 105858 / Y-104) TaxID=479431 RepID=C8X8H5_NAKMY|nr:hypothetical protein [Nakamurella multipartita]ACV79030.1 hypothetical protein Namu_2684 [Nakamurella multipartita DSM 44233]
MEMVAVLIVWPLFFVSAFGLMCTYLRLPTDGFRNRRATRQVALLAACTLITGAASVGSATSLPPMLSRDAAIFDFAASEAHA